MKPHANEAILEQALMENDFNFSEDIQKKLLHFLTLLQQWNRVFNLTAIDDFPEMVYLHLIDSLSIAPYLRGNRFLDVGSGGGLPGLPLCIAYPNHHWTLLDKSQKKTRFLVAAIAELGLVNVHAVCAKVEDFNGEPCFNSIVSRAFGTMNLIIESCEHLLCPDGVFLMMKGKYPEDEIQALKETPGFIVEDIFQLDIKGKTLERHLVRVRRG